MRAAAARPEDRRERSPGAGAGEESAGEARLEVDPRERDRRMEGAMPLGPARR
jgi:hypothetical protein